MRRPEILDADVSFRSVGGASRLPRERTLEPRGPKKFRVEKAGSGVRAVITDWDHESVEQVGTSAVEYHVYWAEDVDMTTAAGVSAGFARAMLLAPAIPAPGRDDVEATAFYSDPKYLLGYFYCVGVDSEGQHSDPTAPMRLQSGTGGAVPPDVEHFQVSESGEQQDLTTLSVVSWSLTIPDIGGHLIDRVQFYFDRYPTLADRLTEGESVHVTSAPGGSMTGQFKVPPSRRVGTGTITIAGTAVTGVGTNFLSLVSPGNDYLEIFGYRALITSVTSNTSMTLSAAWPAGNPAVSGAADWVIIGAVTVYAVSVGDQGQRRDDPENSPSATIVLDGLLSTPNAPTVAALAIGNIIRVEVTPPAGTQLARILLYRGTGTGTATSKANGTVIATFEIDHSNPTKTFAFDDSDFTVYQREQGQVFAYAATAINVRDQESAFSTADEEACRLDSPSDGGGTNPARFVAKNLLWDAMLAGDAGDINAASNASVDANMGVALPAGYYRAVGSVTGVGSAPAYQNGREILLAMTAASANGQSIVSWATDASDHATNANRRVPKGKMVSIQWQARHSAGSITGNLASDVVQISGLTVTGATNATPIVITSSANHGFATGQKRVFISGVTGNTAANGVWHIVVLSATTFSLYDNATGAIASVGNGAYVAGGTINGLAGLKRRSSTNDAIDFDGYQLIIAGSDITDVHSLYWGAFYLDPGFITTQINARIYYETSNWSGVNIAIIEPMLALGDGIPYWSAEIDANTTYPPVGGGVEPPRGRFTDLDGSRGPRILLP